VGLKYSIDSKIILKIWGFFSRKEKKQLVCIFLMLLFGTILEMVGIGLIIPIISLFWSGNIENYPLLSNILASTSLDDKFVIIILMLVFSSIYFAKNLYLAYLAWIQSSFTYDIQSDLSKNMFALYLKKPYAFHLQRNTAQLIRNIQSEIDIFINYGIIPCLFFCSEGLVVLGLLGLLVFIEPIGTLVVFGIIASAAIIFQKYTEKSTLHWGEKRQFHEGLRLKQLHQGLGGIKDVKILGREQYFLSQYDFHTKETMRTYQRQLFVQSLPRLWLEFIAILGLAVLIVIMLMSHKGMDNVISTIAVFTAIAFRILPSANRVINSVQQLKYGSTAANTICDELQSADTSSCSENEPPSPFTFSKNIEIINLSFRYTESHETILSSISFSIKKGEMVGFIGESGSGKSTLIDIILGLLFPSNGKVLVDGNNINSNLRSWQNQIGYIPQTIYLTDDTLRSNIAFGLSNEDIDEDAVLRAIKLAQLENLVENLPEGMNTIVGERGIRLSGGQRQRIGIARALYHDPSILVLDEATSALDVDTEAAVIQGITALHGEKTILMVTHRLSTVKKCDRLYKIEKGILLEIPHNNYSNMEF